jgi:hypothetical protein
MKHVWLLALLPGTVGILLLQAGLSSERPRYRAGAPFMFGETAILPSDDSQNAGLLVMQEAGLTQACQVQSQCFYVTTATGSLRLGIYDNGNPRTLEVQAPEILAPTANSWNCSNYPQPGPVLPVGTHRLAYEPSSGALGFRKDMTSGTGFGQGEWSPAPYGPFPASVAVAPIAVVHWSHYVTCQVPASPTPPPPTTTTTTTTTTTLPPPTTTTTTTTLPPPTTTTTTLPSPTPSPSPSPSPTPTSTPSPSPSPTPSPPPGVLTVLVARSESAGAQVYGHIIAATSMPLACVFDYGTTINYGSTQTEPAPGVNHFLWFPASPSSLYYYRLTCGSLVAGGKLPTPGLP